MNLRAILTALKNIDPNGIGRFSTKQNQNGTRTYTAANLNALRHTLTQLANIPPFARFFQSAAETSLFKRIGDELDFNDIEYNRLQGVSLAVQNVIPAMMESLTALVGEEGANTIYIRLPDSEDLSYVAKTMENFEKILAQVVYNSKINGSIKLVGWEKGSLWLEILLGTAAAATVVSHVVKSAAIAYRRILENRMITAQIEGLEAKAESMQDIRDGLKKSLDMLVDAEARQLYDQFYRGNADEQADNEQIERLKHSVESLAELMNKGAEVQPGLLMPPEVKQSFPDMKNLPALVSSIKAIGQGTPPAQS